MAGCVAPPPHTYALENARVKVEGRIAPDKLLAFSDCVMDGFDRAHFVTSSPIKPRQQRRADGYRIDAIQTGTGIALVTVDLFDSGSVRFIESPVAGAVNTSGEREAFGDCLRKFQLPIG